MIMVANERKKTRWFYVYEVFVCYNRIQTDHSHDLQIYTSDFQIDHFLPSKLNATDAFAMALSISVPNFSNEWSITFWRRKAATTNINTHLTIEMMCDLSVWLRIESLDDPREMHVAPVQSTHTHARGRRSGFCGWLLLRRKSSIGTAGPLPPPSCPLLILFDLFSRVPRGDSSPSYTKTKRL